MPTRHIRTTQKHGYDENAPGGTSVNDAPGCTLAQCAPILLGGGTMGFVTFPRHYCIRSTMPRAMTATVEYARPA